MSRFIFGYEGNGKTCDKGCHQGIGDITPETRAARAARMREITPDLMPNDMKAFISDWEAHHGKVHFSMGVIGTYSGYFDETKHMKGQPMKGAIYMDQSLMPQRRFYND